MSIEDFVCEDYRLGDEDDDARSVSLTVRHRYTQTKDGVSEKVVRAQDGTMLAILLIKEKVFLNSFWWEKDWPEEARKMTSVSANCNDVFAWGCADAEELRYEDIEAVFEHFEKDPAWGVEVWCIQKRKEMPQRPVEKAIRAGGVWDLDALKAEHGLRANHYDGISRVLASRKYETYAAWEHAEGREPLPYDAGWWEGWRRFTAAHPQWCNAAWKAEDDRRIDAWRVENGYGAST